MDMMVRGARRFRAAKAQTTRGKGFQILGGAVLVCALAYSAYYFLIAVNHVETDNAYVGAEIAQVAATTGGTVLDVKVADTQEVKAGDVLVVLDETDAKLNFARLEAQLAQAGVQAERTAQEYKRRAGLAGSGSVSAEEVANADNAAKAASAAYDAAKAMLAQAKVDLERTVVRSPIDGVVAKRAVQLGGRVQAGTVLMSVVPKLNMHVNANFKEVQLRRVRIGQAVELTSDKYGSDVVYHGVVEGVAGGTGAAFALIPAQNATGNWIKVVQRLPVRIALDAKELEEHPLEVGLSMYADIDISDTE